MKLLDGLFTWTVDTPRLAAGRWWKGGDHIQMLGKVLEYSEEGALRRNEACQQDGMATVKEGGILSVEGPGVAASGGRLAPVLPQPPKLPGSSWRGRLLRFPNTGRPLCLSLYYFFFLWPPLYLLTPACQSGVRSDLS